MINLLPEETRTEIMYGRRNLWILHRLLAVFCVMIVIVGLAGVGTKYAIDSQKQVQSSISQNNTQLESGRWGKVMAQDHELGKKVEAVAQVLDQEVRFSEIVHAIATTMPDGSILTGGLSLAPNQSGPVNLTIKTKNQEMIPSLASTLTTATGSPFKTAVINNTNCAPSGDYPCTAQITATFKDNVFKHSKVKS